MKLSLSFCLICSYLAISLSFLTSCTTVQHNKSQKLLAKVSSEIKNEYNISESNLIALYNLTPNNQKSCLFHPKYPQIINNENYNQQYLRSLKSQKNLDLKEVKLAAQDRINTLKAVLENIDAKYHVFKGSYKHNSIVDSIRDNPLNKLQRMTEEYAYVPIFLPQESPAITSHYGHRNTLVKKYDPKRKQYKKSLHRFHHGIDLQGAMYSSVFSSADGKVVSVERSPGYGNVVLIDHGHGFKTRYAHLNKINVNVGDRVIRAQEIGTQGNTGRATGHHLHFEIILNNKQVDPYDFIGTQHTCLGCPSLAKRSPSKSSPVKTDIAINTSKSLKTKDAFAKLNSLDARYNNASGSRHVGNNKRSAVARKAHVHNIQTASSSKYKAPKTLKN